MYKNLTSIVYYQKKFYKVPEKELPKVINILCEKIETRIIECISGPERELLENHYLCPFQYNYHFNDSNLKKIVDATMSALISKGETKNVLFAVPPEIKIQKTLIETLAKSFHKTLVIGHLVTRDQWRLEFTST